MKKQYMEPELETLLYQQEEAIADVSNGDDPYNDEELEWGF